MKGDEFNEFISYARFVAFEGDLPELYDRILSKKLKAKSTATFLEQLSEKLEIDPIDLQTEQLAWVIIEDLCKALISKYPTMYIEDERLLADSVWLTENQKNCITIRMQEKRIVHKVYQMAQNVFKLSDFERAEANKESMVNHKSYGNGLDYI